MTSRWCLFMFSFAIDKHDKKSVGKVEKCVIPAYVGIKHTVTFWLLPWHQLLHVLTGKSEHAVELQQTSVRVLLWEFV